MRIHFVSRVCLSSIIVCTAFSSAFSGESQNAKANVQRKLEQWKAGEGDVLFYGKVVDQTGSPVLGAIIGIDVPEQAGYMQRTSRKQTVVTDAKGCFDVSSKTYGIGELKGSYLFIESISKAGYEYIAGSASSSSFTYRGGDTDHHMPRKNQPVIFKMRKIEVNLTFLIQTEEIELEVRNRDSERPVGWDLIRKHRIKDTRSLVYDGEPLFPDLQVKAAFNTNDATWAVVLSPGNTNGGIIVSDQLLYEAPDTGYQPEYSFNPEDRKPVKAKYVYLKSREPAIYTRLEIEHINANKEFFRF